MRDPALVRGGTELYWIAGLNLANVVMFFYGPLLSYLKLWAQFFIDDWAAGVIAAGAADAGSARMTALGACAGLTLLFGACGYFSRKGMRPAFFLGFALYAADTVATVVHVGYFLQRDGSLWIPWWMMLFAHGYFMVALIGALKGSGKAPSSALSNSITGD